MKLVTITTAELPRVTATASYNGEEPELVEAMIIKDQFGIPFIEIAVDRIMQPGDTVTFDTTLEWVE